MHTHLISHMYMGKYTREMKYIIEHYLVVVVIVDGMYGICTTCDVRPRPDNVQSYPICIARGFGWSSIYIVGEQATMEMLK